MAKKKKEKEVEVASCSPSMNKDWEGEGYARDLMRAEEIKMDPDKMKAAQKHLKKQKKVMRSVDDLINYRNNTDYDEDEE